MKIGDINKLPSKELDAEWHFIVPHLLANGEIRTVEVYTTPIVVKKIKYLFLVIHDITEHKQVEETLKEERQWLHNVLEIIPVMVCLLTPDYHVAFANRAFRNKFGESHGRHCYEYCFGEKEPCGFCEAYRVLKTGKPHRWQVTTTDGSVVDAYDFPFTDVDGSPMILEVNIDITGMKNEEKKLEKKMRDLETFNKIVVGRELRIVELKKQVKELEARLNAYGGK